MPRKRFSLLHTFTLIAILALSGGAASAQSTDVVNAFDWTRNVTKGAFAAAFAGEAMAEVTLQAPTGAFPFELGGVRAYVDDRSAGLLYVSPYQINLQIPLATPIGAQGVRIEGPNGSFIGVVRVIPNAPVLFTRQGTDTASAFYLNVGPILAQYFGDGSAVTVNTFTGQSNGTVVLILEDGRTFAAISAGAPNPPQLNQVFAFVLPPDIFNGEPKAKIRVTPDGGIPADSNTVTIRR